MIHPAKLLHELRAFPSALRRLHHDGISPLHHFLVARPNVRDGRSLQPCGREVEEEHHVPTSHRIQVDYGVPSLHEGSTRRILKCFTTTPCRLTRVVPPLTVPVASPSTPVPRGRISRGRRTIPLLPLVVRTPLATPKVTTPSIGAIDLRFRRRLPPSIMISVRAVITSTNRTMWRPPLCTEATQEEAKASQHEGSDCHVRIEL